jgi:hypothetical protein
MPLYSALLYQIPRDNATLIRKAPL